MLASLHIENMAVISRVDVDLFEGLNVFTGETGSGKSVMIDSILFLLGGRPSRDLVRSGEALAVVEGVFTEVGQDVCAYLREAGFDCDGELLLQRTLSAEGKTKCRLNGRVIPQAILREISKRLVNIHGQNDNQLLLSRSAQEKILDAVAVSEDLLVPYREAYEVYTELLRQAQELKRDSAQKERLRDILRFQINEIDHARLKVGEEEALLSRRTKLQNAEKISKQSDFAYRVLYGSEKGVVSLLDRAMQAVRSIGAVLPETEPLFKRLSDARYEIEDVAGEIAELTKDTDADPTAALNAVEERLDTITKLCRKYGAEIPEVLAFREESAKRLASIENSDEAAEQLEQRITAQKKILGELAERLYLQRTKTAEVLSGRICSELAFLDMPSVRFEIAVKRTQTFGERGADEAEFLLSANPGEPLLPLERVASGGELARVMLTLQSVLNREDGVQTAIFDEVDTGISGKTAQKIGIKLATVGKETQVLCVTHSAQIASLATAHFKIAKQEQNERTFSTVTMLDEQARVREVARILGGIQITRAQLDAAAELIEEGRMYR